MWQARPGARATAPPIPTVATVYTSWCGSGVSTHLATLTGADPVDTPPTEPDRERYLDKQVRPVMEPTLGAGVRQIVGW